MIHVIVPQKKDTSDAENIIAPLLIIIPIAALLIFIFYKIKAGEKTNKLLDVIENIINGIEKSLQNGIKKF